MGLGDPAEAAPAWRQPCDVLAEEGPTPPGPSRDQVMTTLEDPSPAQPGGTSDLRWVLRVRVCRERKGGGGGAVGRASLAPVLPPGGKGNGSFSREEKRVSSLKFQGNFEAPLHPF